MRPIHLAFVVPLLPLYCSSEPASTHAAEKKPFDVHDLVELHRASQPALSPDGRTIAFVLRTTDMEANKGRTDLWMMKSNGKGLRQLTSHASSDWAPYWMSDKTVGFLSTRSGSSQVHAIEIDGGEARQVTDLPVDVETFRSSPDGTILVFSASVYPECDTIECTVERDKELEKRKATGRMYDKLFVRHWDTWKNGKRNHLFAMRATGGEPLDLMKGLDADCPLKPFGGVEDYSVAPNGKTVAFAMKKPMGSEEAWSTNDDIWVVPTDGSSPPKNLTASNEARDSMPVYSPDGKSIAYLAMKRPGYEADRYRVVLHTVESGEQKVLTEQWDRSPYSIAFGSRGAKVWVTADNLGQHSVYSIDLRSGKEKLVIKDGSNHYPMDAERGLVFLRNELTSQRTSTWLRRREVTNAG